MAAAFACCTPSTTARTLSLNTMILLENQTQRITFVADDKGRWLIGSTVLDASTPGCPAQFEVT